MASPASPWLLPRDESVGDKLKDLLANNPLGAQVEQNAVLVAIFTSLGITAAIFVVFLLMRPFNTIVYAPRLRHTDEKHRPPPMDKTLFAWYKPVFKTNEDSYVDQIGMDATVFLRFARMCRNMFIVLAVIGCAIIIPVNVSQAESMRQRTNWDMSVIIMMTPQQTYGTSYWAFVFIAYVFDIVVCGFLWWTYRAIHRLRRRYMETPEYQNSLNSRTLMITDVSKDFRTDQGLVEITDSVKTTPEVPRTTIGRNVKDIPNMIEAHSEAVRELETVLAKYLKNPKQLPATRPQCQRSKKDPAFTNSQDKVDAIEYLTTRIQRLEVQIKEARESVDKRDPMPYGFASYETLESAHNVAFLARNKHTKGTTIRLAPRPKDIIWKNLLLDPKTRRWKRFINNIWITLLTLLYFIPNAGIAIFLSKLSNLGRLWNAFQLEMNKDPGFWAVVQGILAPALTSLFYYFLPIIFRRLSVKAGDQTKSSREKHVVHQLYAFFVFNNLFVFSLFGAAFGLISAAVEYSRTSGAGFIDVIREIHPFTNTMLALCNVSTFWVTWLVQRNLGAAIDLSQVVNLAWGSFSRKFLNPTPRELIERTAPPPFDYASYYNYFLFYSTVALCFSSLQPITLVVTAFYFSIDSWMKKYLLMYVFCTKNETGGLFWRVLFNRMLVAAFLSNCIVALMVGSRGTADWTMLGSMAPLPFLLLGFKFYCKNKWDKSMKYYHRGHTNQGTEAPTPIDKESRRRDRVATRFGHPSLYQKLTVPMVNEKSRHLLSEVYRGRLDGDLGDTAAFSDVYSMKRMSKENPGKAATGATGPFEFVSENNMDFENYKNQSEFNSEYGGEGSIYGASVSRPETPSTVFGENGRGRSTSRDSQRAKGDDGLGVTYPTGYHHTPSNLREISPSPEPGMHHHESNPYQLQDDRNLLSGAAPMGHQAPGVYTPGTYTPYSPSQNGSTEYFRR